MSNIPEQTNTNTAYNNKVREIAEDIGYFTFQRDCIFMEGISDNDKREYYNTCIKEERVTESRYVTRNIDVAKTMVAAMAKSFEDAWNQAWAIYDDGRSCHCRSANDECRKRMIRQGLIPDTITHKTGTMPHQKMTYHQRVDKMKLRLANKSWILSADAAADAADLKKKIEKYLVELVKNQPDDDHKKTQLNETNEKLG